ncbi:MAG: hypothetical protein ACM3TN_03685 [Alphaproteobacteria bacterium]
MRNLGGMLILAVAAMGLQSCVIRDDRDIASCGEGHQLQIVDLDMAAATVGNLDNVPKMNPLLNGIKDLFEPLKTKGASALEFGGVPLHPGAWRAYREAGWLRS